MLKLAGYLTTNILYDGTRTQVYRGRRSSDGQPVIIKVLRNPNPTFKELVQFRNQYVITRNLDHRAIVRPLALERYGNGYALVMPDDGAIGLWDYWQESDRSRAEFLSIAIGLADALHYLTRERIIHKDIKPANILIHPETRKVQLIDFSISSLLPLEQQQLLNPNVLEGTLAYISPEQTGRMNRGIDYRTDFYSLGVTFFELLTGFLPFASSDPMELVHCHIAQAVQFPVDSQVDEVLQAIVLKMMAENAENRYQSALGLKQDLSQCLQQLEVTGTIASFALGTRDACDRFIIPEKLYGREAEVQRLLDAFDRMSAGATEMMLVAGFSGIGKTAVINEVHKPIARQRGYFIKGKFDQFNRNIPFSAFVQAFRDLMRQLLGSDDGELQEWKAKILEAVGENGQVIIDVIPELEGIIGSQPPAPELSGSAAQNRFNLLFEKFIAVFTTKDHPLTIFIDDLQWADSASLNLMKVLMGDSQTGYLLLLGAYRDNEVFPAHPLMLSLEELEKQKTTISTMTIAPLSVDNINQLVAETLSIAGYLAASLTNLVYQKTRGNPFFTTQFLKGLHEDGLITFNHNLGYWECDLVKVRDAALTDDVVEFMAGRLHKLPEETQEVLKLAACIGNQFDLETLAIICETPSEEVATDLWSALGEGLILPQSEAYKFFQGWEKDEGQGSGYQVDYRFLHDRVQQAAYTLIPKDLQQATHLSIGRRLLETTPSTELEQQIFIIVNQLNLGSANIETVAERMQLVYINLTAAKKARLSSAYDAAFDYCQAALDNAGNQLWQDNFSLALNLHMESANAACSIGNFDLVNSLVNDILSRTDLIIERAGAIAIRIQAEIARNALSEAIYTARSLLSDLGITLPENATQEETDSAIATVRQQLMDIGDVGKLPPMTDPEKLAAIEILSNMASAAYIGFPSLYPSIVLKQIELSLQFGYASETAYAFSTYGLILSAFGGDPIGGNQAADIALLLLEKNNSNTYQAKILNLIYCFIRVWRDPLATGLVPLQQGYQAGLSSGDLEFAAYCGYNHCQLAFHAGENLLNLRDKMADYGHAIDRLKQTTALNFHQIGQQAVLNFTGESDNQQLLLGPIYDERIRLPQHEAAGDRFSTGSAFVHKLLLAYHLAPPRITVNVARQAEAEFANVAGTILVGVFYFYHALALLGWMQYIDSSPETDTTETIAVEIEGDLEKLQGFAVQSPTTFTHKWELVQAEQERLGGGKLAAIELYDRAIAGAKENGYIQEEALANELAAKFYLGEGKEKVASGYMQEAYYCYARWGAKAKTDQLETQYPQLLGSILQQTQAPLKIDQTLSTTQSLGTATSDSSVLDLASALKASQAISEEISLDALLSKLMHIVVENAGADRGSLILNHSGTWVLAAQWANRLTHLANIALDDADRLPLSIINTVKRTQQTLLINDIDQDKTFPGDPYLIQQQPLCLFCTPILHQGKLIGILYLENNLTAGAFTTDRIEVLNLLTAQAAISIENAQLYNTLEQKVQQRTAELSVALENLKATQKQLVESEKMAALGGLVAGVAHEINTPIGTSITVASTLADETQSFINAVKQGQLKRSVLNNYLDLADQSTQLMLSNLHRAGELIGSFKQIATDQSNLEQRRFHLKEYLEEVALSLAPQLKQTPHTLAVAGDSDITIESYPGALAQIVTNLVTNSLTHGYPSSEVGQLRLEIRLDGDKVQVEYSDDGCGISQDHLGKIFEPFFTTARNKGGTGLGLHIVYNLVTQKLLGTIEVSSEVGKGTRFVITLPLSMNVVKTR
ncbi:MAG: AAA family ATPase [Hormoscilla sp.]